MTVSRRTFTASLTAGSLTALGVPVAVARAFQSDRGISHAADSIHLEALIPAAPARVYSALTDAAQFDRVARLSAAMKTMSIKDHPSVISAQPGGSFALFGGYVTGRQIELVPGTRIVQAWRAGSWKDGEYSLVRFELTAQGAGTKVVLDHTGFPAGEAQHLSDGWNANYLEPLKRAF